MAAIGNVNSTSAAQQQQIYQSQQTAAAQAAAAQKAAQETKQLNRPVQHQQPPDTVQLSPTALSSLSSGESVR
jgi:hypothetical protein